MKRYLIFILLVLAGSFLRAEIKLPAFVGNNMVLQREAIINIWGWADPGEKVTVIFREMKMTAKTAKDGKWSVTMTPQPAGGPFVMTVRSRKDTIVIRNILVGDVWMASGQSNMEMELRNINNGADETEDSDYPQIRLITVKRNTSFKPLDNVLSDGWKECSPESVETFSAVAYLFGRELNRKYNVPIGLIHTSWSGTAAESWVSAEGLKEFPEFSEVIDLIGNIDPDSFRDYLNRREEWIRNFGSIDRASERKGDAWADTETNDSSWPEMTMPGFWSQAKELKGYYGIIWFRKTIEIPEEAAGKPLVLNIPGMVVSDSTFFNGHFVGSGSDFMNQRTYKVPADLVRQGENLIAIRIQGANVIGGMVEKPDEFYVKAYRYKIPLAGIWKYRPGPDLSNLPIIRGLERFNQFMPEAPCVLFNAMIAPLIPYSIKGVIWYQGETNASEFERADQYYRLFPALIEDWRSRWGYNFPFLFVQLAGYQPDSEEPADYRWARLREAQSSTLLLPNTGMAVAIDIGNERDIHPKNKQDVAHRLFLAACKVAYGENIVFSGPTLSSFVREDNKVWIRFENIGSGLMVRDKYGYLRGFAIAGADRHFVWARSVVDGNDVVVFSDKVDIPVAVRYNWGNCPDGNLYNNEGLPAIPFRTDSWPSPTDNQVKLP
jgi:sialate O-acetylesterase